LKTAIKTTGIQIKAFYLQTDTQEICFKRNIKIYIKNASICFGLIIIIRERAI
jgi:hypothetical protein